MNLQIIIKKLIEKDLERCEMLHEKLKNECAVLPEGSLIKRKNGNLGISVRENGKQYQIVLPPDEEDLIFQLKKKRYIKVGLPVLNRRIRACKSFLENSCIYDPVDLEKSLPNQYENLEGLDIFLQGDVNPESWNNLFEEYNSLYSEHLIHQTPGGILMRSKSEVLIGTQLEMREIPYHYEPLIKCGGRQYCPDFEILHPILRRKIYLEHLGLIEDPVYTIKNLEKLKDYAKSGIVLGYNLFFTYETRQQPLTITTINKTIDEILALSC